MANVRLALSDRGSSVPTPGEVRIALNQLLASTEFRRSRRLSSFIRYVVETTLDGHASRLKGYTIAVEALGRPASFDPQTDACVRVEAMRLRHGLARYYSGAGRNDATVIEMTPGSYVPSFRHDGGDAARQPWARMRAAVPRLLAALGRGLLRPLPEMQRRQFDGRENRQG